MPYVTPSLRIASSSASTSFIPSPPPILSPVYTPPTCSSHGQSLTSPPLPTRRSKPLPIPTHSSRPPRHTSPSSAHHPIPRLGVSLRLLNHTDSTEILRHGKHAQQSSAGQTPTQQQAAGSQHKSVRGHAAQAQQQPPQQAPQPQQAQAYYDDMPNQGLKASNGEYDHV